MRVPAYITALLVIAALLLPMAAQAQDVDEPTKLNVRLGLFRPLDSTTKTLLGESWSCEELIYDLKRNESNRPTIQAELGLLDSIDTSDDAILLSANKLWWQKPEGNSLYYGAGLGIAKLKVADERKLTATGQLFVGYSIRDSYFVELRGLMIPSYELFGVDVKLTGVMISVGTRKLF